MLIYSNTPLNNQFLLLNQINLSILLILLISLISQKSIFCDSSIEQQQLFIVSRQPLFSNNHADADVPAWSNNAGVGLWGKRKRLISIKTNQNNAQKQFFEVGMFLSSKIN